jgi:hypothetical protein
MLSLNTSQIKEYTKRDDLEYPLTCYVRSTADKISKIFKHSAPTVVTPVVQLTTFGVFPAPKLATLRVSWCLWCVKSSLIGCRCKDSC